MVSTTQRSRPGPADRAPVASVTSAAHSAAREREHRMKVYLVQMGLRIIAFPVGAWLIMADISVVVGVALLAFAAVIPYVAVVLANARQADPEADGPQAVTPRREGLTAPTGEPTGPRVDRRGEVIVGDVVDD